MVPARSIKTYRDLLVWQKSMDLVTEIYRLSKSFPQDELYGLSAQIRRSAVSVPSNIAEGYGRQSKQDYLRFLKMASGSLYELQTQIEISQKLSYISKDDYEVIFNRAKEIERMLSSMIRKVENSC